MTQAELNNAEAGLQVLRNEIIARGTERPVVEKHADPLDNAIAAQNTESIATDRNRDARRLREINAALDAIRAGEYGMCAECGESIPAKRLIAALWATLCINCQDADEKKEKEANHEPNRALRINQGIYR